MCSRKNRASAFTLIELLVVVAIIALLISILLPSLSKARAQARSTLCASRIGQLTKAMLIYADDYDECPPFIAAGHKDVSEEETYANLGKSELELWEHESWLFPGAYFRYEAVYLADRAGWNTLINAGLSVRDGTLFPYTRFEEIYRCPEFERIKDSSKTQDIFNYTRSVLGRKLLSGLLNDADAGGEDFHPGEIMKISGVYSPAAMIMMLDEQWDFHVAGNYNDGGTVEMSGFPMGADTIHGLAGDMVGSYHGPEGYVIQNPPEGVDILPAKMGNVAYYDGHVALVRDPWPWRRSENLDILALAAWAGSNPDQAMKIIGLLLEGIFAQRGVSVTLEFILGLV